MAEADYIEGELAEALGRAIAARRAELGLKRNDLRDRANLSYPYIAELENGTKRPSSRALAALADALELRPSELLERAEQLRRPDADMMRAAPRPWFHAGDAPRATPPSPPMPAVSMAAAGPASDEPPLTESRLREIIREVVREELQRAATDDPPRKTKPRPRRGA